MSYCYMNPVATLEKLSAPKALIRGSGSQVYVGLTWKLCKSWVTPPDRWNRNLWGETQHQQYVESLKRERTGCKGQGATSSFIIIINPVAAT